MHFFLKVIMFSFLSLHVNGMGGIENLEYYFKKIFEFYLEISYIKKCMKEIRSLTWRGKIIYYNVIHKVRMGKQLSKIQASSV